MADIAKWPFEERTCRFVAARATRTSADRSSGDSRSSSDGDGTEDHESDCAGSNGKMTFRTYTDDEYGYRIAYPAEWLVEAEPTGGASFGTRRGSAGAVVYVDEGLALTLGEYVAAFLDELAADEYVRAVEALNRRDVALEAGGTGRAVEYAYRNAFDERWRLAYLFVLDGTTGYTLGVDWNDADRLEAVAARIVESFALGAS
ncbi:hypothetical protein [Haladaptatus sp. DYF46]|uniref:hypothetical protein n=1 Tax=Haladaptatus sp. DYF46 TaxID=2886041 RepID=UPI001E41368C|nr:hypothetical protein [Haladaptatus sp. DYF46]